MSRIWKEKMWGVVLALMIASAATAAEGVLTGDQVSRWIQSQEAVRVWGKKHADTLERHEGASSDALDMTPQRLLAPVHAAGLYESLSALLDDYGFRSPEIWAELSMRIARAAMALELEAASHNWNLDAQLDQIDRAENLTAEQKAAMKSMLRNNYAAMQRMMTASEQDKARVRPYMARLRTVLGVDEAE